MTEIYEVKKNSTPHYSHKRIYINAPLHDLKSISIQSELELKLQLKDLYKLIFNQKLDK